MLSKKMTFSLMSLITLLALAFVAPSAIAANDFDAGFSVMRVSAVSDHNAMYATAIDVTLTFGAIVDGAVATGGPTLTIFVEDKFGSQTSVTAPTIKQKDINSARLGDQFDSKTFMFTIPAAATNADDVKVHLHVAEGVAEIVPTGSVKTSKEGKLTIDLVGPDAEGPGVVSIALAPGVIVPFAGYTGATIDVIITLSEKPNAFTAADHLDVAEATAADPVALDPVAEQTASELQTQFAEAGVGDPPRTRGVYDETVPDDTDGSTSGAIDDIADTADVTAAENSVREMYGGRHRAINEAATLNDDGAYMYKMMAHDTGIASDAALNGLPTTKVEEDGDTEDDNVDPNPRPAEAATTLKAAEIHPLDDQGENPDSDTTTDDNITFPAGTDRTKVPTLPDPGDYATDAAYLNAIRLFNAQRSLNAVYQNELNKHKAYNTAVMAEQMMDQDARDMHYAEQFDAPVARGTGYDSMLHPFLVKITPKYANKNAIVVKVKTFDDQTVPIPMKYIPHTVANDYVEGMDKLTIKIGKEVLAVKTAGIEVNLLNEGIIPDGYLVVAKSKADSAVRDPGDAKKSPADTARQPFGLTYNLIAGGLPNLETLLINGGTIDLISPNAGLAISEIMWGSDASIGDSFKSQYIEIRNTSGADIKMGDKTHKLIFYTAGQTLPDMAVAANNIQDRVGTVGADGYWSVAGKGQSGRTGVDEAPGDLAAVTPTQAIISMQRAIDATGVAADGTLASSWASSVPPGLNFDPNKEGTRIGSPGRAPTTYPTAPTPEPEPVTVPVAESADIVISEIMVDTSGGRLPQWIELTNVSGAAVSLAGWSVDISNDAADADVVGGSVSIDLSGTLGVGGGEDAGGTMGKSLLLVGGAARSSSNLVGSARVVDVSDQVGETGRYTLISEMAFMVALVPPQKTGVLKYGDTAGNLDAAEAWEIPMAEGARSSLIRREMDKAAMATMGTAANGWVLASSTALVSGPTTWYGSNEDAGTPGYDAGGPLPVELSVFYPARDRVTGAVVIKWETQSELNNAGFFIKRSNQRSTNFKVINAAMIQGAGTTSEKQSYTYTDTTAQPNVVYYYQIEDVSFDGNRQQLIRGTRLRGHIGAGGKLTTKWGDLKTSQ